MPALAFGLKSAKPSNRLSQLPAKRKAAFDDSANDEQDAEDNGAFGTLQKPKSKATSISQASSVTDERARKSPKLDNANGSTKYNNLSALRSAKLQDNEASKLDASVYDYDEVYDTFKADKNKNIATAEENAVPKYMTNLLASAEVRKRDQLRAKEKALQKERDAEGDEFADKEKFVTGAYKQQQEELRQLEEEEKKREQEEDERRRKGGGMTAFHKDLLKKDDHRQRAMEEATKQKQAERADGVEVGLGEEETSENILAGQLNQEGAHIVVNDDGEIVDKRQLLSAGLNVAPKKSTKSEVDKKAPGSKPQEWHRSAKQQDARLSQRERQSRMIERQIEEMTAKQKEAEETEQKVTEEKNKSRLTETDKLSAKERYLQRKREREEEAKMAKARGDG